MYQFSTNSSRFHHFSAIKFQKFINLLTLSSLLLSLSSLSQLNLVNTFTICDQQCSCIQSSGKFTANCSGLSLQRLPQCNELHYDHQQRMKRIQVLWLQRNNFPRLNNHIFHDACLDNLQKIYLQQSLIAEIDDQAFMPLTNIIELSLSENYLTLIPTKSIEHLIRLQSLDLSYNRIRDVSNNSFVKLINLRKLSLESNNISHVDVDAFNGLNNIQQINLASNHLQILDPHSFINLKSLHTLYLESNEWNCNCHMQPFKRMLIQQRNRLKIIDQPRCYQTSIIWSNLALDHFQCSPKIYRNIADDDYDITLSEGSTLRLRCSIEIETFGDPIADHEYLSLSQIKWYWNDIHIMNNSKGCDHNCNKHMPISHTQEFLIDETIEELNSTSRLKISQLTLYSVMTINAGNYRCSVVNNAGSDELLYNVYVVPYYSSNNNQFYPINNNVDNKILKSANSAKRQSSLSSSQSSDQSQMLFNKNTMNNPDENTDHVLFGLVLGILSGLFLVLVIFSIMFVFFVRNKKIIPTQELIMIDTVSNTDNNTSINTLDDTNHELQTDTTNTERNASSQNEFNPLLIVNPIKKPPRLGIPDVSSIYSTPSFTLNRNNMAHTNNYLNNSNNTLNNQMMNQRSRYASYAESEPLYSPLYSTLYRNHHNRQMANRLLLNNHNQSSNNSNVNHHNNNNESMMADTFISDTASEV